MADSTVTDVTKMKVVDLRKELKTRGLSYAGDKAELVARLQAAMSQDSQDDHADINLDSDEIDSDGVLEDEDDKSHNDILDDAAVDTINEELALADSSPPKAPEPKHRMLKRKITMSDSDKTSDSKPGDGKDTASKKIVLNRTISVSSATPKPAVETTEINTAEETKVTDSSKVRITADIDSKTRLEMRAKRFGLPVQMSEAERKEARKQRFGQSTGVDVVSQAPTGTLSENLDKLKKRAERFGQSVSKIMTDIEKKERLEKRKAKFGAAQ